MCCSWEAGRYKAVRLLVGMLGSLGARLELF